MHGVLSFAALSCLPSPICVTNSGCTANLLPEWTECPMQHVLFLFLFLIALFIFTHIGPALLTVRGNGKVIDRSGCNCYFWYFFMRKKKTWFPSLSCIHVRCRSRFKIASVEKSSVAFFPCVFRLEPLRWSLPTLWRLWRSACRLQVRSPLDLESVHWVWSVTWASSVSIR